VKLALHDGRVLLEVPLFKSEACSDQCWVKFRWIGQLRCVASFNVFCWPRQRRTWQACPRAVLYFLRTSFFLAIAGVMVWCV